MADMILGLSSLSLDYFYNALTKETAVQVAAVVVLTGISTILRAIWRFICGILGALLKALSSLFR